VGPTAGETFNLPKRICDPAVLRSKPRVSFAAGIVRGKVQSECLHRLATQSHPPETLCRERLTHLHSTLELKFVLTVIVELRFQDGARCLSRLEFVGEHSGGLQKTTVLRTVEENPDNQTPYDLNLSC